MIKDDFKKRMKIILGDEFDSFMNSYDNPEFHALRINHLKVKDNIIDKYFDGHLSPVPFCHTGYYYDNHIRPGKHPYHEAGAYYIQEPSAMLPGTLIDAKPGETILDLCAAPGGKSTQIAAMMNQKGLLISNEIMPARAKILSENIERMGIRNAIVTNESSDKLASFFPEFFHRIMVDAPCSGEGMFRKNEQAQDEWSLNNVKLCADRQAEILDNAAIMLKPGGRIVYSTCTFSPEENEISIINFLKRHSDFHIEKIDRKSEIFDGISSGIKNFGEIDTSSISDNCFRIFPHKFNGEGHFACVLTKDGNIDVENDYRELKGLKEKSLKEYNEFAIKFFKNPPTGKYIMFGDNINLVPETCPKLDKIRVLRAGLNLGTVTKGRFIPSHSLALSLSPDDVKNVINLSINDENVYKYINGETFEYDTSDGWCLICIDNLSIGIGKVTKGIVKNHYPKGLRKRL